MKNSGRKTDLHLLRLAALIAGLLIFYFSIQYFGGFHAVMTALLDLSPWTYFWVVVNSLVWTLSYTQGWKLLMHGHRNRISFVSLFKVKACGEAVNLMTPAGFIVGDPVRVLLLKKYLGDAARWRSVIVDRVLHSLSAHVFCILSLLLLFTQNVGFPLWLTLSILFIYLMVSYFFVALVLSLISGRGFGIFEPIFRSFKVAVRFPKWNEKLIELRSELEYYKDKPKRPFLFAFLLHFFGRILGVVELIVIFYFLTGKFLLVFAIILSALTSFVAFIGGWVPGSMGFLEALYAAFAQLYGFNPAMGITTQIIRRLRTLFWIATGILILDYREINRFILETKDKQNNKV